MKEHIEKLKLLLFSATMLFKGNEWLILYKGKNNKWFHSVNMGTQTMLEAEILLDDLKWGDDD